MFQGENLNQNLTCAKAKKVDFFIPHNVSEALGIQSLIPKINIRFHRIAIAQGVKIQTKFSPFFTHRNKLLLNKRQKIFKNL